MNWQHKRREITELIRHKPHDADLRITLIQCLCMCGDWSRALKQIDQFKKIFPDLNNNLLIYLFNQVESELRRTGVFQANHKPLTFQQNVDYNGILEQQLSLLALFQEKQPNPSLLTEMHTELLNNIPDAACTIQYRSTATEIVQVQEKWLIDGDARIATVCELFVNGQYYWQPWYTFSQISFIPPQNQLDVIWRSAQITLKDGKTFHAVIPARYYFEYDEHHEDALLSSVAQTTWTQTILSSCFMGQGQKMLYGEQNEYPYLDIENLMFSSIVN
ncbi:MAG: type VI secretion system accessory protein TagJ [Alysiella sp.]|uniref:type VI secretion system accessory protein TagJ n=1 Tax=Alysiella sp. TaxID=1872483 RepID=UPI0026DD2DE7|nr:type VI secretion system accessory protein TagJ [Alysiella sp.]MDO4433990.1 type VI secretion system accessory protein TagJ [Alysiella sp.]